MNHQHARIMLVIDLGEDRPSEFFHELKDVLQSPPDFPLIINVIHSNTGRQELTMPESQAIHSIFTSLNNGTENIEELYIHSRFKSSLPHPALILYGPLGRGLRSLVLRYDFDDNTLGLSPILHLSQPTIDTRRAYPTLTDLKISGTVLLEMLKCDAPLDLLTTLANILSFSVDSFRDCIPSLVADHITTFFNILGCLTKLRHVTMEEFSIPAALRDGLPASTQSYCPISLRKVTLVRTGGYALSYLLNCLVPYELILVECHPIEHLPPCTALSLYNIGASYSLSYVLSKWEGLCLTIESGPSVDDTLARYLDHWSRTQHQALWPHLRFMNIKQRRTTLPHWLEVLEVRSRRLGRPPTPLFVDSQGHRDLRRWAVELSNAVNAATAPHREVAGVRVRFSNA